MLVTDRVFATPPIKRIVAAHTAQNIVTVPGHDGVVAGCPLDVVAQAIRWQLQDQVTVGIALIELRTLCHVAILERHRPATFFQLDAGIEVLGQDLE